MKIWKRRFSFFSILLGLLALGFSHCQNQTEKKITNREIPIRCTIDDDAEQKEKFEDCIQEAAKKYRIRGELIWALIKAESNFDPDKQTQISAQIGLLQLHPRECSEDIFETAKNIDCGGRLFRKYFLKKNDEKCALWMWVIGEKRGEKLCVTNNDQLSSHELATSLFIDQILQDAEERKNLLEEARRIEERIKREESERHKK